MKNRQMQGLSIEAGYFDVDVIMQIQWENTAKITEYMQNQLKEDRISEQLETELEYPFAENKKQCVSHTT